MAFVTASLFSTDGRRTGGACGRGGGLEGYVGGEEDWRGV